MGKNAAYSILNANSLGDKRSGGYKHLMITIKSKILFLLLVKIVYTLITIQIYVFMNIFKPSYNSQLYFWTWTRTCPPKQRCGICKNNQ